MLYRKFFLYLYIKENIKEIIINSKLGNIILFNKNIIKLLTLLLNLNNITPIHIIINKNIIKSSAVFSLLYHLPNILSLNSCFLFLIKLFILF